MWIFKATTLDEGRSRVSTDRKEKGSRDRGQGTPALRRRPSAEARTKEPVRQSS